MCVPADVGSVVNVSSIAGLRAYPGALAYKMSKAAMDQMTRWMAHTSNFMFARTILVS